MNKIFLLTVTALLFVGFSSLANANGCVYSMGLNCPPSEDPQSFISGLDVQINGVTGAEEPCPPVERINFDWGDSLNNDAWFPATHTYPAAGDYTITGRSYLGGVEVASSSCVVSIPCQTDLDCDDGLFCTGVESCIEGTCGAVSACPPAIDGCIIRNYSCDEANDQCVDFPDDSVCEENEMCAPTGDCVPILDCVGFYAPFDAPMVVKNKSNRALPLKFDLFDEYGIENTELSPPPIVEVMAMGATGADIAGWDGALLPAGLSDDGGEFVYDFGYGWWVLNLGMKAYTAGATYTISVKAGDDSYVIDGCTETFTRQN